MSDEGSKIFIDESWKERVQREQEEARQKQAEAPPQKAEEEIVEEYQASFEMLVRSLMAETMMALGMIAPQDANEVMVDLERAKFSIDMLEVLRKKTAGNLTPEEEGMLKEGITRLQSYYMALVQHLQEQEMQRAGINLQDFRRP